MGEVYRAADGKLGREVALKVLPPGIAGEREIVARFQREARAVAAISHPHIITIFSVEEAEGIHFLTMELIEGRSLKQVIAEGPLPIARVIEIGGALADALAAAHEKGIVHRDLKPANVMITAEGRVKVLDFGLAKATLAPEAADTSATVSDQTRAGVILGTPAYMSPEQIAGRVVDARTDIFSLGIVLYEMTSGLLPFAGTTAAQMTAAILCDAPQPLRELRDDAPEELGGLIHRCLEKGASERFASARELRHALHGVRVGGASARTATASGTSAAVDDDSGAARALEGFWIAVLPLKHSGGNTNLAELGEGLTEEIVTGLSRFSYLRVVARSSTAKYAQAEADARAIGREVGAQYVIEGSLRLAGSRLRLAVHLVDTSTGTDLWAETYDRAFLADDIFALQDDVVPRIVSTVADTYGVLPRTMAEKLRGRHAESLTPYEAVLRSFAHFPRLSPEEHAAARAALERGVSQAPGYADGWAMLSMIVREEYVHGFNVKPDPLGRALVAAQRAVEIAPSNHLAYHSLAATQFFRRERQAFRSSAERAIALNPMDGFTTAYLGFLLAYDGNWERGCRLVAHARMLNPHHPGWYWFPSCFEAFQKRDYRAALDFALKVNMPGFWRTSMALAAIYGHLGDVEAARNAVRELLAVRPQFAVVARTELGKYWEPKMVEHIVEGLRKAGLEVVG
jgi:TolB-like protein